MSDSPTLHNIDAPTLKGMIDRKEVIVIDVREPNEYGFERIPSALLMPLATFDPGALPANGDKKVVLHCAAGRRSTMAAEKIFAAGASEAYHLAGGFGAWKEAGLPTVGVNPMTGAIERRG